MGYFFFESLEVSELFPFHTEVENSFTQNTLQMNGPTRVPQKFGGGGGGGRRGLPPEGYTRFFWKKKTTFSKKNSKKMFLRKSFFS